MMNREEVARIAGVSTTTVTRVVTGQGYVSEKTRKKVLDAVDVPPEELRLYFDDFEKFRSECRFNTCLHLDEPDCAVKAHLGCGVGRGRYERYKLIYAELDDRRKNKYD